MTKQILNCLLVLLLTTNFAFSQSPGGVEGPKYWIMNEAQTVNGSNLIKNTLNFHPEIYFNAEDSTFVDEGRIKAEFTFFAVVKSKANANTKIAKIKSDLYKIKLYPDAIKIDDSIHYQKGDPAKGVMVCFKANKNKLDRNREIVFKLFNPQNNPGGKRTQLLEFIYYPRLLNSYEQNKVETYLSIKYGISLLDDKPYVAGKNIKLWNREASNVFQHRITGLGRLDESKLNQKQSVNIAGDEIKMGVTKLDSLNMLNNSNIANGSYLLWGDNDENFQFSTAQTLSGIKILNRKWRVQLTNIDSLNTVNAYELKIKDVDISSKLASTDAVPKFVWLAINDNDEGFNTSTSRFIKSSGLTDGYWGFKDIIWDTDLSKVDLFSVVLATDAEIETLIAQQQATRIMESNDENAGLNNLKIYPNPIKPGTEFNVDINFDEKMPVLLTINNLLGQQFHREDLGEITNTTFRYKIYNEGVYLISIVTPNKKYFQKLVVKQ